jgi:hypothetical protein
MMRCNLQRICSKILLLIVNSSHASARTRQHSTGMRQNFFRSARPALLFRTAVWPKSRVGEGKVGRPMIRGNGRSPILLLASGLVLAATTFNRAEAAAIGGDSGSPISATVVLRGVDSASELPAPTADSAPVVLRGSHPRPANAGPEPPGCSLGYYYDPSRGCVPPEDAYTPDYGYWPSYGWGWPFFNLQTRQPRRGVSHHRFPGHAIRATRHLGVGFGRGASHFSGFAHR